VGVGATPEVVLSPILVRPVREQLEHDRVIRLLQARYKKKFDVGINPGPSLAAPVGPATAAVYPDVVLLAPERSRKLLGVIEVETGESVNHLEAMSQWAAFARLKVPFLLYVPAGSIDTARRLSADYQIPVAELWTYHTVGDEIRFTLIQRTQAALTPKFTAPKPESAAVVSRPPVPQPATPKPVAKAAPAVAAKVDKSSKSAKPAPVSKSARALPPSKDVKPARVAKAASKGAPKGAKAVKPGTAARAATSSARVKAGKAAKPAAKAKAPARPAARKAAPPARRPAKSR